MTEFGMRRVKTDDYSFGMHDLVCLTNSMSDLLYQVIWQRIVLDRVKVLIIVSFCLRLLPNFRKNIIFIDR